MKRIFATIIVLGLWMWFCSYWYVCGVKNLCPQTETPPGSVPIVLPTPEPEPTPEPIIEPVQEPVIENKPEPLVLDDVYFIFNTTLIKNLSILDDDITKIKQYINSNETAMIYMTGHTCDQGTEKKNFDLGLKRAETVRDYMKANGISEEKIILDSKGSDDPKNSNNDDVDRMYNRRVNVLVKVPE